MGIRAGGGVITQAVRDKDTGILQVHASFLMEGELVYSRRGKTEIEINPWEYIADENSLITATGKPITVGHPPIKDSWVTRNDVQTYGKGVTGNMLYLHRPFAVISCIVTDQRLADDIESGHVQRVSSCRKTIPMIHRETKQKYQGTWEANHLAFIDKRSGRTGRSPGAMLLSNGDIPLISDDGTICLDSTPGLGYDIPDYSKFVRQDTSSGLMLFLPPELEVDDEAEKSKSRRIIILEDHLVKADEDLDIMELTAEELAAIGTAAGAGINTTMTELFTKFQDSLVAAISPVAVADETPVFSQADVDEATKLGLQKGRLLSIAAECKADSVLTETSSVKDICIAILKQVAPEVNADSYDETELPGLVQGLALRRPVAAEAQKENFVGKKVADDKKEVTASPFKSMQIDRQRAAMQKAYALQK